MNFVIHQKELVRALTRALLVIDKKCSMPILQHVAIVASPKRGVQFSSTDLARHVVSVASADVITPGAVTLPAKQLFEIAKKLPNGPITFQDDVVITHEERRIGQYVDGKAVTENVKIEKHTVTISAGSKITMLGDGVDNFPQLPDTNGVEWSSIDPKVLANMIDKTIYAAYDGNLPAKMHLASVFFESHDGLRMVATNGERLSIIECPINTAQIKPGIVIPIAGIKSLQKLLKEKSSSPVEFGARGANIYFRRADAVLGLKTLDVEYPDYAAVIPVNSDKRAICHRGQLTDALSRMLILSKDDIRNAVKFEFSRGSLTLTGMNGKSSETLDVDYIGAPFIIGFDAQYVYDFLCATEGLEVAIEMYSDKHPGLLTPVDDNNYIAVIMPVGL